jgi:hypothetical protein
MATAVNRIANEISDIAAAIDDVASKAEMTEPNRCAITTKNKKVVQIQIMPYNVQCALSLQSSR